MVLVLFLMRLRSQDVMLLSNRSQDATTSPVMIVLLVLSVLCTLPSVTTAADVTRVQAVIDHKFQLPCSTLSSKANDRPSVILWQHKRNTIFSVYSTGNDEDNNKGYSNHNKLPERNVTFVWGAGANSYLVFARAQREDAGRYHCLVEFDQSSTVTTVIELELIVPPGVPTISVDSQSGRKPPYRETDSLTLTCESIGGDPNPRLSWWQHGRQLQPAAASAPTAATSVAATSVLTLQPLQRPHTGSAAPIECRANNNNISSALRSSVTIDAMFPPLSVGIVDGQLYYSSQPQQRQQGHQIKCKVTGSRPPAKVTWWLNDRQLTASSYGAQQQDTVDGDTIVSKLVFQVDRSWNGKRLKCLATNEQLAAAAAAESAKKDGQLKEEVSRYATWKITVHYAPVVQLVLGKHIHSENVTEGDNVYLECEADSAPPFDNIAWFHNGVQLQASKSAVVSNMSLVLQAIDADAGGSYQCHVTNSQATTVSNTVTLTVRYAPYCKPDQALSYRLNNNSATQVYCYLEANPNHISVDWQMNNGSGWQDVDTSWYTGNITGVSTLNIPAHFVISAPNTSPANTSKENKPEFSVELACSATNQVSKQTEPCYFKVLPPDAISVPIVHPPRACQLYNRTSTSLWVQCQMPTLAHTIPAAHVRFHLEAYRGKHQLLANVTQSQPVFHVDNLPAQEQLLLTVYTTAVISGGGGSGGVGDAGSSSRSVIRSKLVTLPIAQQTAELKGAKDGQSSMPTLAQWLMAVFVGVTLLLLLLLATLVRHYRKRQLEKMSQSLCRIDSTGGGDGGGGGGGGGDERHSVSPLATLLNHVATKQLDDRHQHHQKQRKQWQQQQQMARDGASSCYDLHHHYKQQQLQQLEPLMSGGGGSGCCDGREYLIPASVTQLQQQQQIQMQDLSSLHHLHPRDYHNHHLHLLQQQQQLQEMQEMQNSPDVVPAAAAAGCATSDCRFSSRAFSDCLTRSGRSSPQSQYGTVCPPDPLLSAGPPDQDGLPPPMTLSSSLSHGTNSQYMPVGKLPRSLPGAKSSSRSFRRLTITDPVPLIDPPPASPSFAMAPTAAAAGPSVSTVRRGSQLVPPRPYLGNGARTPPNVPQLAARSTSSVSCSGSSEHSEKLWSESEI